MQVAMVSSHARDSRVSVDEHGPLVQSRVQQEFASNRMFSPSH